MQTLSYGRSYDPPITCLMLFIMWEKDTSRRFASWLRIPNEDITLSDGDLPLLAVKVQNNNTIDIGAININIGNTILQDAQPEASLNTSSTEEMFQVEESSDNLWKSVPLHVSQMFTPFLADDCGRLKHKFLSRKHYSSCRSTNPLKPDTVPLSFLSYSAIPRSA